MRSKLPVATASLIIGILANVPASAQKLDPEFLKAREAREQALDKGDQTAFGRYTADDFFAVGGTGVREDRAQRVARANVARRAPAVYLDEKITLYGDNTVILSWRTNAQNGEARTMEVWIKEKGLWKVAAVQVTPIQSPQK
jgi:hypothetical protein